MKSDLADKEDLRILSESSDAGIAIVFSRGGREFYLTGHSEYSPLTLHEEYVRDREKGLDVPVPKNYYRDNIQRMRHWYVGQVMRIYSSIIGSTTLCTRKHLLI
nr:homoserine O-succinyltransferase [Pedobacter hiemivivus]